jgi:uncharacterized membrane protein YkvA (DUF1232 family)
MDPKRRFRVVYDDDFYQGLRRRVKEWSTGKGRAHRWVEFILLAPDFLHLMVKLSLDPDVPKWAKVRLVFAIAYFVSPLDLLPEAILGPVGYLDDLALAAWVIDEVIRDAGPEVVRRHWAGEADVFEAVARVIAATNDALGAGLVKRLRGLFDRQKSYHPLDHGFTREPGRNGFGES